MGWIVAGFGRQPWVIEGILPTAVREFSNLGASTVLLTILGFVAIYTVLFIIEMGLMIRAIRLPEPDSKPEAMLAPASIAPAE